MLARLGQSQDCGAVIKLQGGGGEEEGPPTSKIKLQATSRPPPLNPDAVLRLCGRANIGRLHVNDLEDIHVLLDTGSTVNTITPQFVVENDLSIYPLIHSSEFEGCPASLKGLKEFDLPGVGVQWVTKFTQLRVRVPSVKDYDADAIFLIVPPSDIRFSRNVPLLLGMGELCRVVRRMRESEIDELAFQWDQARHAAYLTCPNTRKIMCTKGLDPQILELAEQLDEAALQEGQTVTLLHEEWILPGASTTVQAKFRGEFQSGCKCNVMVEGVDSLPNGISVANWYTSLQLNQKRVPVCLYNSTNVRKLIPKGTPIARIALANKLPPLTPSPGLVAALEEEDLPPEKKAYQMSIEERQEKLLQELDLSELKNWPQEQAKKARELLLEYHNIFSLHELDFGHACNGEITHTIELSDTEPFRERYRPIPGHKLDEVCKTLDKMLQLGVIQKSNSPWTNAVVLARKKGGELRFCIDFRKLNDRTVPDGQMLPRIEEAINWLSGQ